MTTKLKGHAPHQPRHAKPTPKLQKRFQEAISLHQQGMINKAIDIYEEILSLYPSHFDALHLSGVCLAQSGKFDEAAVKISESITINQTYSPAYNNLGISLRHLKRFKEALANYDKAISLTPDYAEAHNNRGTTLMDLERFDEALSSYDKAISLNPAYAEAYNNRGNALAAINRDNDAFSNYEKAIELNNKYADAYVNRGSLLMKLNRLDEALASYDKAITLKPGSPDAYYNKANVLKALDRPNDALTNYNIAITINGFDPDYFMNRGDVLVHLNRHDEALLSYNSAIDLKPNSAEAHNRRGCALVINKRYSDAILSFDNAISLRPDFADAYNNLGNTLKDLKQLNKALLSYDKAISIKSDFSSAYYNRGNVLSELKRFDEALMSYEKAISVNLVSADTYNNRGLVLMALKRFDEALASYDRAISLQPHDADAYNNRGNALKNLGHFDEALASYDRAINLKPAFSGAYNNRGFLLMKLKRFDEALESFEKVISLDPQYEWLAGTRLHTQLAICSWDSFSTQLNLLKTDLRSGAPVSTPFWVLGLFDDPSLQGVSAQKWSKSMHVPDQRWSPSGRNKTRKTIRIGYYSADFHNHATLYLMAELFEQHNNTDFEFYGFSFGTRSNDMMRQRVLSAFKSFYDVNNKSDIHIVELSRQINIDIAVDLKGYTTDARTEIFAARCAPIQVNYLGYPGTMGTEFHDYIVADHTLIPNYNQQYYSEKVVYLPNSYQVNDSKRRLSFKKFTRADLGLPDTGFVFCCFSNNWKILPEVFDIWMRLLNAVNGSVLWLLEDSPAAAKNLRKEAADRGVDPQRLVFAKRLPLDEHLARHCCADLFLDTLPCNAHTTASDALWAGLPVLTQIGKSFAARVAASLLTAMDLPELITHSREEYEAKALDLALNPEMLAAITAKVVTKRRTSPLFDAKLFARHIEAAYTEMIRRYDAGLKPTNIEVSKDGVATSPEN